MTRRSEQNKHLFTHQASMQGEPAGNRPRVPSGCGREGEGDQHQDHAARLARIKAQVQNGTYRADIMDIAAHLAKAMDSED